MAIAPIEIRTSSELNRALGAFSSTTNKIYLSQEFLTNNINNPDLVGKVLLEEIGHSIDSQVNQVDAFGDEGEVFSILVQEGEITSERLSQIQAENDHQSIQIDGQTIDIETSVVDEFDLNQDGVITFDEIPAIEDIDLDFIKKFVFQTDAPLVDGVLAGDKNGEFLFDGVGRPIEAPWFLQDIGVQLVNSAVAYDIDLGGSKGNLTLDYAINGGSPSITDSGRLQLIYEGNTIFDTQLITDGGVSRTVTIPISGTSNNITAVSSVLPFIDPNTGNAVGGTTTFGYKLAAELCPDTQNLNVEGNFELLSNGQCRANGTVHIGWKNGISRMIRLEGGEVILDGDNEFIKATNVTVFAEIGNETRALFSGSFDMAFGSGITTVLTDNRRNLNTDFQLGGLDVDIARLDLNRNNIGINASWQLTEALGNIPINANNQTILIEQNSVKLGGPTNKLNLVDLYEFRFLVGEFLNNGVTDVKMSDITLSYEQPQNPSQKDKLKLQSKLELDFDFKNFPVNKITADFEGDIFNGPNFIQIEDGKTDVKGALTVTTDLETANGKWGFSEAKITIDTIADEIGGSAKFKFPFGSRLPVAQPGIGFKLPLPPLEFNQFAIDVDNLNIPIYSGVFLQRVAGGVTNLATSDRDPIELSGGLGLSLGPQFNVTGIGTVCTTKRTTKWKS